MDGEKEGSKEERRRRKGMEIDKKEKYVRKYFDAYR